MSLVMLVNIDLIKWQGLLAPSRWQPERLPQTCRNSVCSSLVAIFVLILFYIS